MLRSVIKKYFSGLTKNSIFLACASFFSDISTEMLYPVLPVYLTRYMKTGGSIVGIIDGISQATQNIIQGFSGYLSDRFQSRKPIALAGYILSAASKPFIGMATAWPGVLAARFSDRLGAGTRAAPRDALIASSVAKEHRGKAFGLEGLGDNLGAFIGPLVTVLLFFLLRLEIRSIFYLAVIPGSLGVLMILFVRESHTAVKSKINIQFRQFPKAYWKYLIVIAVFGVGNSSNSFLILQIQDNGLPLIDTVLVYAMFNLVAALISYPAGSLSDKFGRKLILLISFVIFLISYSGFAFTSDTLYMVILFLFYGLFQGIFRSVGKSCAADFVSENLHASSIGWYSTVVGISGLLASIIAGQLWDDFGHTTIFVYGAVLSFLAIILLVILIPDQHQS